MTKMGAAGKRVKRSMATRARREVAATSIGRKAGESGSADAIATGSEGETENGVRTETGTERRTGTGTVTVTETETETATEIASEGGRRKLGKAGSGGAVPRRGARVLMRLDCCLCSLLFRE